MLLSKSAPSGEGHQPGSDRAPVHEMAKARCQGRLSTRPALCIICALFDFLHLFAAESVLRDCRGECIQELLMREASSLLVSHMGLHVNSEVFIRWASFSTLVLSMDMYLCYVFPKEAAIRFWHLWLALLTFPGLSLI